jgi:hypothetical protein
MKKFKIRCSAIGQIMPNAVGGTNLEKYGKAKQTLEDSIERYDKMKTKDGINGVKLAVKIVELKEALPELEANKDIVILSDSAKTYCQNWIKKEIYKKNRQMSNKYTEKGLIMEDNSLDFIAEEYDYGLLLKNEEYFENDFLTGTPDVVLDTHLIDVKNSWSHDTFPLFATEIPDKAYFYQGQGYMELTGKSSYKLIYTLMDTPEHLIEKEFRFNNFYGLEYEDFRKNYLYEGFVPAKRRKKSFYFQKDEEVISAIKIRVEECQQYINQLLKTFE